MASERKVYIDIAKGIAMVCVVLAHLGIYNINRVVFNFSVAIFFIITGYFISNKQTIKDFIYKKIETLIVPYFFVSIVILVFTIFKNEFFDGGMGTKELIKNTLLSILYGTGADGVEFLGIEIAGIGVIWFLLATFWASIVLRLLLDKKPMIRLLMVITVLVLSCSTAKILFLPFSIQPAGLGLFYMYVGYLARQVEPHLKVHSTELKVLLSIVAIWCWVESVVDYKWFLVVLADVGRGMTDLVRSICGCYGIILLAKLFEKSSVLSRLFSYIGKYSIMFMSIHLIELRFLPRNEIVDLLVKMGVPEMVSFWSVVILRLILITSLVAILSRNNLIRKIFGFPMIKKEKKHE